MRIVIEHDCVIAKETVGTETYKAKGRTRDEAIAKLKQMLDHKSPESEGTCGICGARRDRCCC